MLTNTVVRRSALHVCVLILAWSSGCTSYPLLGIDGASEPGTVTSGGTVINSEAFTEELIQERTFIDGTAVTTVTYEAGDVSRRPVPVDFNGDGKTDPVVAYGGEGHVVQILLSQGPAGEVDFLSLTLDGNGRWDELADVAVADLDGDGALDLIAAAAEGVVYLHNPGTDRTTILREWGNSEPALEYLEGSTVVLTAEEIAAILEQTLPPTVDLDDYNIELEQGYANVEAGDLDGDGDADVAASRHFKITLTPKPETNGQPIEIIDGELQIFVNPGGATTGEGWALVTAGLSERYAEFDRFGAAGLLLADLDDDGALDLLSASRDDVNVHVAWFQNPGVLDPNVPWTQYRVGSVRDAFAVDLADVTGDGRPDVVATGGEQMQLVLFEHPDVDYPDDRYEYDWDTYVLATFESFEPRDVKALDIDGDGELELVVGGTNGAVRYFEAGGDARDAWAAKTIVDLDPPGEVGLLGYGDLDADDDIDVVAVVNDSGTENELSDRITWIRNDVRSTGVASSGE